MPERLLEEHAAFARGLARERVRRAGFGSAEADEVVQEAWLALLKDGGRALASARDARAYIAATVLNAARMWLRSHARSSARDMAHPLPAAPEAPDEPILRRERIEAALSRIDPEDQLLIRWVYWEGLGYDAVARLKGVEANSVGPMLSRVRERLRAELEALENPKTGARTPPGTAS